MKEGLIIFMGGAPTAGKTTIASQLSKKLGVRSFSTDDIRDEIKKTCNKENYPALFETDLYEAEEYLNKFSSQEIVDKQNAESEELWFVVKDFIEKYSNDNPKKSLIIEGVAVLPHLVAGYSNGSYLIKPVFLVDQDSDRIREAVFKRGLWDYPHLYSDDVKEKEVEWVKLFSSWLKEEAKKYNYPVVEADKSNDVEKIISALGFDMKS